MEVPPVVNNQRPGQWHQRGSSRGSRMEMDVTPGWRWLSVGDLDCPPVNWHSKLENGPGLKMYFLLKMGIFHGYVHVSLPEANFSSLSLPCRISHSFCCFDLFCVSFDEKQPLSHPKNDICAGISTGGFHGADTFLVGLRWIHSSKQTNTASWILLEYFEWKTQICLQKDHFHSHLSLPEVL